MDMNVNSTECLKTVNFIGYQEVHNICDGTFRRVPWGSLDWSVFVGALGFAALVFTFFAIAARELLR